MNDEIKLSKKEIIGICEFLKIHHFENAYTLLDYITNLQQAIEVKNERIKEEQQEKERYIKFYNELNVWNKKLQQEKEDNLKCIKSLKEQLESVIKNNQELLEKWYRNNDKIVNLISENERLKEEYKNKLDKTLEVLQYELQFQTGGCYHRLSNLFDYLQNGSDSQ